MKAMMPTSLSRLQSQPQEYRLFYLKSLTMWCFVAVPVVGYLVAEASFVVRVLLGDQWIAAVPLVRMLGGAGLATALGAATEWLLLPLAHMKRLIALRVVRACTIAVGIMIGWRWGINGIAIGYSVSAFASFVIEMMLAASGSAISRTRLTVAFIRPMIAAAAASVVVLGIAEGVPLFIHVIELPLYFGVYLVVHSTIPGGWVVIRSTLRALRTLAGKIGPQTM